DKAARISTLTRDLSELLPQMLPELVSQLKGQISTPSAPVAYHPPCTLQHGQKLRGGVEGALRELGFDVRVARTESHLCCGSAGTYSVLQPEISHQLRDRKIAALDEPFAPAKPAAILSANMGCIVHLQNGTEVPVMHWVELLDQSLTAR
ncbi:MAG: heterodisulfide reductase-related iron-sulfur binding cluster, partial [Comamonas sp.]